MRPIKAIGFILQYNGKISCVHLLSISRSGFQTVLEGTLGALNCVFMAQQRWRQERHDPSFASRNSSFQTLVLLSNFYFV